MAVHQLRGREGAAEEPYFALHAVNVPRKGQVAVARIENLFPELRNVRRRDVVEFLRHVAVGRAEIVAGQRAIVALTGQRAVVGDTRQGDRIVAAPQVDRFVVEYAPPHRPLAFDERGDVGRRRQGERIADVVARIVVARDREGSVAAADAAQQTHGR